MPDVEVVSDRVNPVLDRPLSGTPQFMSVHVASSNVMSSRRPDCATSVPDSPILSPYVVSLASVYTSVVSEFVLRSASVRVTVTVSATL